MRLVRHRVTLGRDGEGQANRWIMAKLREMDRMVKLVNPRDPVRPRFGGTTADAPAIHE